PAPRPGGESVGAARAGARLGRADVVEGGADRPDAEVVLALGQGAGAAAGHRDVREARGGAYLDVVDELEGQAQGVEARAEVRARGRDLDPRRVVGEPGHQTSPSARAAASGRGAMTSGSTSAAPSAVAVSLSPLPRSEEH